MDWIDLAQDTDKWWARVTAVINLRIPYNVVNILTGRTPVNFSVRTLLHGVNYRVNYIRHFSHFRKANIRFVMAVRPFIRTHRITRLSLDGLKKKLIIENFTKYVEKRHVLLNSHMYNEYVKKDKLICKTILRRVLLRKNELFRKNLWKNQEKCFMFKYFFFENCIFYEIM
jgi:hypothetical protein